MSFQIIHQKVSCFGLFIKYTKQGPPRRKLARSQGRSHLDWGPHTTGKLRAERKAGQEDYERDRPCLVEVQQRGAYRTCVHPDNFHAGCGGSSALPGSTVSGVRTPPKMHPGLSPLAWSPGAAGFGQCLVGEAGSRAGPVPAGPARAQPLWTSLLALTAQPFSWFWIKCSYTLPVQLEVGIALGTAVCNMYWEPLKSS